MGPVFGSIRPADPDLIKAAAEANAKTGAAQATFLAQYQWGAEKSAWLAKLRSAVETAWSGHYQFHINRPQWEWIGANVSVEVQAHEGAKEGKDNLAVIAIKVPEGQGVHSETTQGDSMTLGSNDVAPRSDNFLRDKVRFTYNSAILDKQATDTLDTFVSTFKDAPGNPAGHTPNITLQPHTSALESIPDLGARRAREVKSYLAFKKFRDGASRVIVDAGVAGPNAADDPKDRCVDLIVGNGKAQVVAAHEFGHAFGLGDEYAKGDLNWGDFNIAHPLDLVGGYAEGKGNPITGSGDFLGTASDHDQLAKNMGLPGAIHENNDSIMSLGNVIRPQHYSTFHAALVDVTGIPEWVLGPPGPIPTHPPTPGPPPPTPAPVH